MSRLPAGVSSSERNSKKPITVPCPFCREPWELGVDDCYKVTLERAKKVAAKGRRMTMGEMSGAAGAGADAGDHDGVGGDGNDGGAVVVSEEGYVNVARELGIDARRGTCAFFFLFFFFLLPLPIRLYLLSFACQFNK